MGLLLDVSIAAASIVEAAWARATANRERTRRRLDVQAAREETARSTINGRSSGIGWELRYTTPTPLQYKPDEPVAYPLRAVQAGEGIAFALIPTTEINAELLGPYGDDVDGGDWEPAWGGHGGIRGVTRGFTNSLWGLYKFLDTADPLAADPSLLRPRLGFGGLYPPQITWYETQTDSFGIVRGPFRRDGGVFSLRYIVAAGTDLRFQEAIDSLQDDVYITAPDNSYFAGARQPSTACTIEAIARLGSGPVAGNSGENRLVIVAEGSVPGDWTDNNAQGSAYEFSEVFLSGFDEGYRVTGRLFDTTLFTDVSGGVDIHYAVVIDGRTITRYFNGTRFDEHTAADDEVLLTACRSLLFEVLCEDAASEDNAEGGDIDNTTIYNGPSVLKAIRYTDRALYSGDSFTPPSSITGLA